MQLFIGNSGICKNASLLQKFSQDEANVLYTVVELSAQIRFICRILGIPHVGLRQGWIINPEKTLSFIPNTNIKKIVQRLVKSNFLLYGESPTRVLPNVETLAQFQFGFLIENAPDESFFVTEWDNLSSQALWDSIPGITKKLGLETITLDQYVEKVQSLSEWAQQYPILDNCPEHLKEVSFVVYQNTGFVPDNKTWLPTMIQLDRASSSNINNLREGLIRGIKLRNTGVTMNHPRSFVNCVAEVVAEKRLSTIKPQVKTRIVG